MTTLSELAVALQTVFTRDADDAARRTGFVRRASPLTGSRWVQTLVFGWLADPQASLLTLARGAARLGASVSPQALDQRWGPDAVRCLREVLAAALKHLVQADPVTIPLLQRFTGVRVLDSTTVALPAAFAEDWPGCGGGRGPAAKKANAALKFQVEIDLLTGALTSLSTHAGKTSDQDAPCLEQALPRGTLSLADLGYFNLDQLETLDRGGCFWLRRLPVNLALFTAAGEAIPSWSRWLKRQGGGRIEANLLMGLAKRLPVRLLAVRVPEAVARKRRQRLQREAQKKGRKVNPERWALAAWTVLGTNLPAERLSLTEALVLGRLRWQIELLFKLWKEHGRLDESRSENPWRILCEIFAKLLGLVVQRWALVVSCWRFPDRSLRKAAVAVQEQALGLARALRDVEELVQELTGLVGVLSRGGRIHRRRAQPQSWQLLLNPDLLWNTYT